MTFRVGDSFGDLFDASHDAIDPEIAAFALGLPAAPAVTQAFEAPTIPGFGPPGSAPGFGPPQPVDFSAPAPMGPPQPAAGPLPRGVVPDRRLDAAAADAKRKQAAQATQGFTPDAATLYVLQVAAWGLTNVYRVAALRTAKNDAGFFALAARVLSRFVEVVEAAPALEFYMPERVRAAIRSAPLTPAANEARAKANALLDKLQYADAVWFITDSYYEDNLRSVGSAASVKPAARLPAGNRGETAVMLWLVAVWFASDVFRFGEAFLAKATEASKRDASFFSAVEKAADCVSKKACSPDTLDKVLASAPSSDGATDGEGLPGWAKGVIVVVGGILAITMLPTILDVVRASRAAGAAGRS